MATQSDLPHWIGELPDPARPTWASLPLWQRLLLLTALGISALMAVGLVIVTFGFFVRLFRWAAWGLYCALGGGLVG